MKLLNAVPVAVASLLVAGLLGLRAGVYDDWVSEQGPAPFLAPAPADSLAFPGAVGWGAEALTGCFRDTVIVETVTSLSGDTSVAGTMANILKHHQHGDTLTIVTWDVGGWSDPITWPTVGGWEGTLECTYLAMQTAPGGGVGYHRFVILKVIDDSHDFVIRGGTFAGDARGTINEGGMFYIRDAQDFIVAEMDLLWGEGEKLMKLVPADDYDTIANASVMQVAFFQPSALEATAFQINEALVTEPHHRRISLYKNYYHGCGWRCPMIGTKILGPPLQDPDSVPRVRIVGNFWYNSAKQAHIEVRGRMVDVLDSYVKTGPYSEDGSPDYSWTVSLHPDNDRDPDTASSVYVDRLIGKHSRDTSIHIDSLWADGGAYQEVSCRRDMCEAAGGGDPRDSLGADIKRDTPIPTDSLGPFPMPRLDPFTLQDELLGTATDSGEVGNYRRIKCDGTWEMRSDSVHSALLAEARDSTGASSAPDSAYIAARMLYSKATGSACDDADGDGMPDAYEDRMADLDKNSATDRSTDSDGDGWTAMEEYVNGTSSDAFTRSDGTEGTPSFTTTYGNDRNVYLVPVVQETVILRDTLGNAVGTIVRRGPDYDSVDDATPFRAVVPPDNDSSLLVTYDTMSVPVAGVQDSADVDSIMVDWGYTLGSAILRSVPIPGG